MLFHAKGLFQSVWRVLKGVSMTLIKKAYDVVKVRSASHAVVKKFSVIMMMQFHLSGSIYGRPMPTLTKAKAVK